MMKNLKSLQTISLKCEKNLENVLAAIALVSHFKIKREVFENAGLKIFLPLT